jgi:hypothetical protein
LFWLEKCSSTGRESYFFYAGVIFTGMVFSDDDIQSQDVVKHGYDIATSREQV